MSDPLTVQCVFCGAKPGWPCVGAPSGPRAGRYLDQAHWPRVHDSGTAHPSFKNAERPAAVSAPEMVAVGSEAARPISLPFAGVVGRPGVAGLDHAPAADGPDTAPAAGPSALSRSNGQVGKSGSQGVPFVRPAAAVAAELAPTDMWMEHQAKGYES